MSPSRSCVIFLTGPHTSQQLISQVLSQFDANLSADIPCCIITSSPDPPLWCGAESPGPADGDTRNWNTTLAGLRFDEQKLREGSLDNVGITLHNLLDELPKYSVTHAVWITEQIPTAGASLILASGLMRFIKCHHGYLSIVSSVSDVHHSPWVKAMKAAVLPNSDAHKLAKIISKCCWVTDINFKGYQNSVDVTLNGILVQGKHTDFVTNGNLTTLTVIQIVSQVPLYLLRECVDVCTIRTDTACRLTPLTTRGLLCKVTYQKDQCIKTKSDWIRAVQTRNIGNGTTKHGPHVLLWRGKLYTFRDIIQPPADQKGGFINHATDWDYERRLLEFFEKAGSSESTNRVFPVKLPSPRGTPAAASVPSPLDILNVYEPDSYRSPSDLPKQDVFDHKRVSKLSFREALELPHTHGVQYYHNDTEDEKIQELQKKYVHRETYSSLSLHNIEDNTRPPTSKHPTRPSSKETDKLYRTFSSNSDKSAVGSSKGKCKVSPRDRSKSLNSLSRDTAPSVKLQRNSKSTDNVNLVPPNSAKTTITKHTRDSSAPSAEPSGTVPSSSSNKPSRSQKNKLLLKTVISECLTAEGVSVDHPNFKRISSKLYDICKMLLRDAVSGSHGFRETMLSIVRPQTKMVVMLEKQKLG